MTLKIGSLFSGYGGLDMGVSQVLDAETIWHCEWALAPSKVLEHHWHGVPNYHDVTTIDWDAVEPIDILTGGYPCQPFSHAGRRKGTEDERHLWPYVRKAIRNIRPRFAFLENVAGHRSLGFNRVLADLAEDGMDVKWASVRASDVGAPHHRERLFILASTSNTEGTGPGERLCQGRLPLQPRRGSCDDAARPGVASAFDYGRFERAVRRWEIVTGNAAPSAGYRNSAGVALLSPSFAEWMMGLPGGHITDPTIGLSSGEQLKLAGNGVVPRQAAYALQLMLSGELGVANG